MKFVLLISVFISIIGGGSYFWQSDSPKESFEEWHERIDTENQKTAEMLAEDSLPWFLIEHNCVTRHRNVQSHRVIFDTSPVALSDIHPPKSSLGKLGSFFPPGPSDMVSLEEMDRRAWGNKRPRVIFVLIDDFPPEVLLVHRRVLVCGSKAWMYYLDPDM